MPHEKINFSSPFKVFIIMDLTLRIIGLIGVVFFSALLSMTFMSPQRIDSSAKEFIKMQIEKEIREKHEILKGTAVAYMAQSMTEKLGWEKKILQLDLDDNLPEKIATIIAAMCTYDCEQKSALTKAIATDIPDRISSITVAETTIGDIVRGKYFEIVSNLRLDLRIFLSSNFVLFLSVVSTSFAKPNAITHLFLPALLLVVATVLSSLVYLIGQDWFYTLVYNDFMGFSYLCYVVIIFAFLLDICVNKARGTCEVINGLANSLGSSFSVSPC